MREQFADGMTHAVRRLLWLHLERGPHGYQVSNRGVSGLFCSLAWLCLWLQSWGWFLIYFILAASSLCVCVEGAPGVALVGTAGVGGDEVEVRHREPGLQQSSCHFV